MISADARLRLPVGNSSLRYTASAGKAIAPTIPPSNAANHIGGPPTEYEMHEQRGGDRDADGDDPAPAADVGDTPADDQPDVRPGWPSPA